MMESGQILAQLAQAIHWVMSVSYTHLDVYKRQPKGLYAKKREALTDEQITAVTKCREGDWWLLGLMLLYTCLFYTSRRVYETGPEDAWIPL